MPQASFFSLWLTIDHGPHCWVLDCWILSPTHMTSSSSLLFPSEFKSRICFLFLQNWVSTYAVKSCSRKSFNKLILQKLPCEFLGPSNGSLHKTLAERCSVLWVQIPVSPRADLGWVTGFLALLWTFFRYLGPTLTNLFWGHPALQIYMLKLLLNLFCKIHFIQKPLLRPQVNNI